MEHELKIEPKYLDAILDGSKRCEIRKNDRDYKVGDTLLLNDGERVYWVKILRMDDYEQKDGWVVLSITAPLIEQSSREEIESPGKEREWARVHCHDAQVHACELWDALIALEHQAGSTLAPNDIKARMVSALRQMDSICDNLIQLKIYLEDYDFMEGDEYDTPG